MVRNVLLFVGLFISVGLFSQYSITGKITSESGEPLVGANVIIEELSIGVTSSKNGGYSVVELDEAAYTLKVSFIGYNEYVQTIVLDRNMVIDIVLSESVIQGEEIIVRSTRAAGNTPTTYSEVSSDAIKGKNMGQDLPYLFGMEPSLVYTSDAGAGVGYTNLWIRGSNIQRINVTVNGIPLNDPESHGVFFVNMPDFASSLESAQIQRGVGTSTNGGGAFGATINLETSHFEKEAFGEINSSFGSFNTNKNNVRFGSGLIKGKWAFDGRLSQISSDGYIDRASSDLKSFFIQGGYYGEKTTVKGVIFSGKEKTYQSWNGVDQYTMDTYGRTFNSAGAIYGLNDEGEVDWWNFDNIDSYYDNETDNYQQDHYQLHFTHIVSDLISFNISGHYTYGRGYYEQYYQQEYLGDYPIGVQYFGLDSTLVGSNYEQFHHDSVEYSDMIVRRWLDNHYYGATYSLNFTQQYIDFILGGGFNMYSDAKHYGEIVWSQYAGESNIGDKFYNNSSEKADFNTYLKIVGKPVLGLSLFADLQIRNVVYTALGTDKGGDIVNIDENYSFFNPKLGVSYGTKVGLVYASYAIAHREPIRSDFLDAADGVEPKPEKLGDIEIGIRKNSNAYFYNANLYWMDYSNQLVLTGEINDVGSPIRSNVGESARFGVELDGGYTFNKWSALRANVALSSSNTDYKREEETGIVEYSDVQLSYSPQTVMGVEAMFMPADFDISLLYKYISKQYLDLTQNDDKVLDAYGTLNANIAYSFHPEFMEEIRLHLQINNILNSLYSSNGYVYWDVPYYYPQAGTNFMAGVSLKF